MSASTANSLVHRDSVQGDDITERKLTGKIVPQQVLMARLVIGESRDWRESRLARVSLVRCHDC